MERDEITQQQVAIPEVDPEKPWRTRIGKRRFGSLKYERRFDDSAEMHYFKFEIFPPRGPTWNAVIELMGKHRKMHDGYHCARFQHHPQHGEIWATPSRVVADQIDYDLRRLALELNPEFHCLVRGRRRTR
jgi:hypothetical protein